MGLHIHLPHEYRTFCRRIFPHFLDYVIKGRHLVLFRETSAQHFSTPNGLFPLTGMPSIGINPSTHVSSVSRIAEKLHLTTYDQYRSTHTVPTTPTTSTSVPTTSVTSTSTISTPITSTTTTTPPVIIEEINASTINQPWSWHCVPLSTDPAVLESHNWRNKMAMKVFASLFSPYYYSPTLLFSHFILEITLYSLSLFLISSHHFLLTYS